MLGYFKYGEFLLAEFRHARWRSIGVDYQPPEWNIVLPVGIRFYTFATLSYTLDVYLQRAKPAKHFLDYALFVTFFPHLVAGPIMRPTELVPQFAEPRRATAHQLHFGLALIILGLFQKVVLADGFLAPVVEKVYDAREGVPMMLDAWVATLAFSGQIFCDFAGYSTTAIGVAMCLGFAMPDNFRFPYAAVGFSDFWRRWHITPVELAARLSLHPARRQPPRPGAHLWRADGHDAARRAVARRGLDVRRLGRAPRPLPRGRALAARAGSAAGARALRRSSRSACSPTSSSTSPGCSSAPRISPSPPTC